MKRRRIARAKEKKRDDRAMNERLEILMKEFLTRLTEASYQVALKTGFRGSFITFLSDLQEALESVIARDRKTGRQRHATVFHGSAVH